MRVIGTKPDLTSRLDFIVDPDAEPADLNEALAEFLLEFVRSQSTPAGAATADGSQRRAEAEATT